MKISGVIAIIGGVFGLIVGSFIYGFASVLSISDRNAEDPLLQFWRFASYAFPICAIVGGALIGRFPMPALIMLGVAAAGMLWAFGFNMFSLVAVALVCTGFGLAFLDLKKETVSQSVGQ